MSLMELTRIASLRKAANDNTRELHGIQTDSIEAWKQKKDRERNLVLIAATISLILFGFHEFIEDRLAEDLGEVYAGRAFFGFFGITATLGLWRFRKLIKANQEYSYLNSENTGS